MFRFGDQHNLSARAPSARCRKTTAQDNCAIAVSANCTETLSTRGVRSPLRVCWFFGLENLQSRPAQARARTQYRRHHTHKHAGEAPATANLLTATPGTAQGLRPLHHRRPALPATGTPARPQGTGPSTGPQARPRLPRPRPGSPPCRLVTSSSARGPCALQQRSPAAPRRLRSGRIRGRLRHAVRTRAPWAAAAALRRQLPALQQSLTRFGPGVH